LTCFSTAGRATGATASTPVSASFSSYLVVAAVAADPSVFSAFLFSSLVFIGSCFLTVFLEAAVPVAAPTCFFSSFAAVTVSFAAS